MKYLVLIAFLLSSCGMFSDSQSSQLDKHDPNHNRMGGWGGKGGSITCGDSPISGYAIRRVKKNGTYRIGSLSIQCGAAYTPVPGGDQISPLLELGKNKDVVYQGCQGKWIKGVKGRAGEGVDGLQTVCHGKVQGSAYFGGQGGEPQQTVCGKHHYVSGFAYMAGSRIDALQVICSKEKKGSDEKGLAEIIAKAKNIAKTCHWTGEQDGIALAGVTGACGAALITGGLNVFADIGCAAALGGYKASVDATVKNCSEAKKRCHNWMDHIFTHNSCAKKGSKNKTCAKKIKGYEKQCGKWPYKS